MILDNSRKTKVVMQCDDCGIIKTSRMAHIIRGRIRRVGDIDYCVKCACKHKPFNAHSGEEHYHWKGGRYLRSGYCVVLNDINQYEFEHRIIFEKHLGRPLAEKEVVHHIDMDKQNNCISNLYLCENKNHHINLHSKMSKIGFLLLGQYIWFDNTTKQYLLHKTPPLADTAAPALQFIIKQDHGVQYAYVYVSYRKYKLLHRIIVEQELGRQLSTNEQVHHVNGHTLDNRMGNLSVMSIKEHRLCHHSLELCVGLLCKQGIINFTNGDYVLSDASNFDISDQSIL